MIFEPEIRAPELLRIRDQIQDLFDRLSQLGNLLEHDSPAYQAVDNVLMGLADARAGIVLIDKALRNESNGA